MRLWLFQEVCMMKRYQHFLLAALACCLMLWQGLACAECLYGAMDAAVLETTVGSQITLSADFQCGHGQSAATVWNFTGNGRLEKVSESVSIYRCSTVFEAKEAGVLQVTAVSAGHPVLTRSIIIHGDDRLVLPQDTKKIDEQAFANTDASEVVLPGTIESIGSRAFAGNDRLRILHLPDGLADIAPDAFEGCSNLTLLCTAVGKACAQKTGLPYFVTDAPISQTNTPVGRFLSGVTSIEKAQWDFGSSGEWLYPDQSYATVLDTASGKLFRVYRYRGGNHADIVPASTTDTKALCEIAGFAYYTDDPPPAAHLANIIKVGKDQLNDNHTWPDFGGHVYGQDIRSALDRRAALLKPDGSSRVFAVSIYAWPHGYTGEGYFYKGRFPNGYRFHEYNNCYGMLCCHFTGSKTHGGNAINAGHQNAIASAYEYAQWMWPQLCR